MPATFSVLEIQLSPFLLATFSKKYLQKTRYRKTDYINCAAGVDADDPDVYALCPMFTSTTDMSLGVYMEAYGKYQAMPVISKVRNNGFDGSGEYLCAVR